MLLIYQNKKLPIQCKVYSIGGITACQMRSTTKNKLSHQLF